ncbi:MAG: hypothetical protein AB7N71_14200, partial [Phycisphaerae bacterium]
NAINPDKIETRDDIVQVITYWPKPPWLRDANQAPIGIRPTVYFASGETEKGAFVSGSVVIQLFEVLGQTAGDSVNRRLVHEWALTPEVLRALRVRTRAITGYHYGFPLKWPESLNLIGKQVDVVVRYDKRSGGSVASAPFRAMVLPGVEESYRPSTPLAMPGDNAGPPPEVIRAKPGETPRVRVKANLR